MVLIMKEEMNRKIEYSIVSRGTERYGSKGYMGVTNSSDGKRIFVLSKHGEKYVSTYKDAMEFEDKYTIENIALSRFELISELAINNVKSMIKDNILIAGFGNLGFSCLIYLLNNGYKNINILTRKISKFQKEGLRRINNMYNIDIKFVNDYKSYDTFIEATGSSDVIKNIIEEANYKSTIILLGMPKEETYLINPLDVARRNLAIFGGHELNGFTIKERKEIFIKLLNENSSMDLKKFVNIYDYDKNIVEKILEQKENFIEVIKYDI